MTEPVDFRTHVRTREFEWILSRYDIEANERFPILQRYPSCECRKTIHLLSNVQEFDAIEVHRNWLIESHRRRLTSIPANAAYDDPRIRRWLYFKASTIDALAPELSWQFLRLRGKKLLAAEYMQARSSGRWSDQEAFRAKWHVFSDVAEKEFQAVLNFTLPSKRSLIDAVRATLSDRFEVRCQRGTTADYVLNIFAIRDWVVSLEIDFSDHDFEFRPLVVIRHGESFLSFGYDSAMGFGSSWDLWGTCDVTATAKLLREIVDIYIARFEEWI